MHTHPLQEIENSKGSCTISCLHTRRFLTSFSGASPSTNFLKSAEVANDENDSHSENMIPIIQPKKYLRLIVSSKEIIKLRVNKFKINIFSIVRHIPTHVKSLIKLKSLEST